MPSFVFLKVIDFFHFTLCSKKFKQVKKKDKVEMMNNLLKVFDELVPHKTLTAVHTCSSFPWEAKQRL